MDALIIELIHRVENDLRIEIAAAEARSNAAMMRDEIASLMLRVEDALARLSALLATAEETAEQIAEETAEQVAEETAEQVAEEIAEEIADEPADETADEPADELVETEPDEGPDRTPLLDRKLFGGKR